MSLMRYTIVQDDGGISFVGDEYMLPALVAACATNPTTYQSLLDATHEYDRRPRDEVRNALAIFDEHNVPGGYDAIHHELTQERDVYTAAFRIVDDKTRHASVQPAPAGVIIFNLKERRIVQMQSDAGEVGRTGQAQHHNGRNWTRRVHAYELPDTWRIVP